MPRPHSHEPPRQPGSMRCAALLSLVLAVGMMTGARAQHPADPIVEAEIATAPVELDGSVLFRVRGISSYPAEERARRIQERLQAVAADPAVPLDSLEIVEEDGAARISAGDRPLMTLVEPDARLEHVRLVELATIHMTRIREAIAAYRDARSPAALQRAIGWTVVATLLFALAVAAVVWLWQAPRSNRDSRTAAARPENRHPVAHADTSRADPRRAAKRPRHSPGRRCSSPSRSSTLDSSSVSSPGPGGCPTTWLD